MSLRAKASGRGWEAALFTYKIYNLTMWNSSHSKPYFFPPPKKPPIRSSLLVFTVCRETLRTAHLSNSMLWTGKIIAQNQARTGVVASEGQIDKGHPHLSAACSNHTPFFYSLNSKMGKEQKMGGVMERKGVSDAVVHHSSLPYFLFCSVPFQNQRMGGAERE